MLISSVRQLDDFVASLKATLATDPRLAIDTEFIRERTYSPVLEIVQIAVSDGVVALIDVPALGGTLGSLASLLLDPDILKILHAGSQDVEILAMFLSGQMPQPLFDTQIAAAFLGGATQLGYGALVLQELKVTISKEESFADWSRRPLTLAMQHYAENDVLYLHQLHTKLSQQLTKRGRTEWAAELTERSLSHAAQPTDPDDLWQKVGGKTALDGRSLAVLRELALWRDSEAQRRDKPRRSVIKDEPLVELSKRQPLSVSALLELRGMPPNLGERTAKELLGCIERGRAIPPDQRPKLASSPNLDEHGAALLELLSAVVRVRATEQDLPPSLLAPNDELRLLAAMRRAPNFSSILFTGWRGEIIGEDLRAVLSGRLSVAWDPKIGRLVCLVS
jgi:ribonuclease D